MPAARASRRLAEQRTRRGQAQTRASRLTKQLARHGQGRGRACGPDMRPHVRTGGVWSAYDARLERAARALAELATRRTDASRTPWWARTRRTRGGFVIVGQQMNGSASHWRLPHRKEYRWAQRARGGMPLRTRGVPASQSALVRLVELCRAESALVRVPRRAHLHGGRIKMANDMQRDQWHGRREAAP